MERDRQEASREFESFVGLRNEHSNLKRLYEDLKQKFDMSRTDFTTLNRQLFECKEILQRKDVELVKLLHKCEVKQN